MQIQSGLELLQQQLWELWQSWDMIHIDFQLQGDWLKQYGVIVLHVKGCDIAVHNRDAEKRKISWEILMQNLDGF